MGDKLKKLYKRNKKYLEDDLDLSFKLDQFYVERQQGESLARFGYFHPSLISKGIHCHRWWYHFLCGDEGNTKAEAFTPEILAIMDVGTAIHDRMHKNLYDMGILEGVWKCICCGHKFWATSPKTCPECHAKLNTDRVKFLEVPLDNGFIRGHADGILNFNPRRVLLELKSIKNVTRPKATYGFEVLGNNPIDDHEMQANIYVALWNEKVDDLSTSCGDLVIVDQDGNLGVRHDDSPEATGARLIGALDTACVMYIGKNDSQRKLYTIKADPRKVKHIMAQMRIVWGNYIQKNKDACTATCYEDPMAYGNRTKCRYRYLCYPDD
jgi:hypothetical protein